MPRSKEPFFWALFSGGGMVTALVLPAAAVLLLFALPLGWIQPPPFESLRSLYGAFLFRLGLFGIVVLGFFHWAHRFRFTLYDGLQLSHLWGLIATVCYGGATLGSALAAWVLFGGG